MRKLLFSLGTIAVAFSPIIGVVSCNNNDETNPVIKMEKSEGGLGITQVEMIISVEIVAGDKIGLTIDDMYTVANQFVKYLNANRLTRRIKWEFWIDGDQNNTLNKRDTGVDMLRLVLGKIPFISPEAYGLIDNYFMVQEHVDKQEMYDFILNSPDVMNMIVYSVKGLDTNNIASYRQAIANSDTVTQLAHMSIWIMLNRANLNQR